MIIRKCDFCGAIEREDITVKNLNIYIEEDASVTCKERDICNMCLAEDSIKLSLFDMDTY